MVKVESSFRSVSGRTMAVVCSGHLDSMAINTTPTSAQQTRQTRGLLLGAVGVLIFAMGRAALAVPLLGETLDTISVVLVVAVIAGVWLGKRMPIRQRVAP